MQQVTTEQLRREEQLETDLENLISRQHDKRGRETGRDRALEEMWAESSRKHAEKQRQQARLEWHLHHTDQAERLRRTLESLIAYHEERAEELA